MATERKLLKPCTVRMDRAKIHTNASRHSALSHGNIVKSEACLQCEVQALLVLTGQADSANPTDGMSRPKKLQLRGNRLAAMTAAKLKIAARAAGHYAR